MYSNKNRLLNSKGFTYIKTLINGPEKNKMQKTAGYRPFTVKSICLLQYSYCFRDTTFFFFFLTVTCGSLRGICSPFCLRRLKNLRMPLCFRGLGFLCC